MIKLVMASLVFVAGLAGSQNCFAKAQGCQSAANNLQAHGWACVHSDVGSSGGITCSTDSHIVVYLINAPGTPTGCTLEGA